MTIPTTPTGYADELFKRAKSEFDTWGDEFDRRLKGSMPEGFGDLKGDALVDYVEWKGHQQIGMYVGPDGAPVLNQQGKAQYVDMQTGQPLKYTYGPNWLQAMGYLFNGQGNEFLSAYMRQLKRRAEEMYDVPNR